MATSLGAFAFMPTAAPKPCCQPGCNVLAHDGSSRCVSHKRAAWLPSVNATKRETGRRLQRKRAALFSRNPLCVECDAQGRVRAAVIRDHIQPLAEGGPDTDANTQGLCRDCHDVKTAAESARGRGGEIAAAPKSETDGLTKILRSGVVGGGGIPQALRGGL